MYNEFRRTEMKSLKKMFVLCSLALVFTTMLAGVAAADGNSVMAIAGNKAITLFRNVKAIIFIVGGFGLVGIAFQAIFGKVKWSWFAGLAVGLAILACASAIVNYATGDKAGKQAGAEESMKDTFGNAATGTLDVE
jgi:hypothetical protein